MILELRSIDENEIHKIEEFVRNSCGCKNDNGGPCSNVFSADKIGLVRAQCSELDKPSLDYVLLGQVMAFTKTSSQLHGMRHVPKERRIVTSMKV